ncbi:MAG: AtpZ/AtpI family protein [Candidatus Omnitrophota bacterium]|nr:MAG: AtpZ/AtpI family protein [Candidatus Omnitrophota bacterium]
MKNKDWFPSLFYISELGLIMVVSILCGLGLGLFLDKRLNTKFFTVLFLILGIIGGFIGVYKTITTTKTKE